MSRIRTERDVYTEILQLYRASPCLWDAQHENYNQKTARNEALQVLVEKYRVLDKEATATTVKRKIDNMRATFKREWKKVQKSKLLGGDEYVPSLWYYELLTFLTENEIYYSNDSTNIFDDEDFNSSKSLTFDRNMSPTEEVIQPRTVGSFVFINSEMDERDDNEDSYQEETPQKKRYLEEKFGAQFDIVDHIDMKRNIRVNSTTYNDPNIPVEPVDEDYHFLLSLLPQISKFDDLQKIKIKMDFMNIIAREVELNALKIPDE